MSTVRPAAVLAFFATAPVLLAGCVGPRFDRSAMLRDTGTEVILPALDALVAAAEGLDEAAVTFAAAPDETGLAAVRDRWLEAQLAWKGVQVFQFEGLLILHNAIERRPAREEFIDATIAEMDSGERPAVGPDFIEGAGATSKGLGAVEYLIHPVGLDPAGVVAEFASAGRRDYLVASTANLAAKARELRAHWAPGEGNHLATFAANDSDGADIRGSVSLLANRIIETYEVHAVQALGRPLGRMSDGVVRPEETEAPLSRSSLGLVVATVETLRRTMESGLYAYLDHLDLSGDAAPLSQRIAAEFDVVLGALRSVEGSLEEALVERPERVTAVYEAMRPMIVLLKTEMAAQLGITVTFSDSDGD